MPRSQASDSPTDTDEPAADGRVGRRPTRDDVARHADVSSAVVSYVVNNGPRPVSETNRRRVLDAVAALGYRPNDVARSLAGHSTRTIGLIAPTLANPVWADVSMGVTDQLNNQSYLLMVCDVEDEPSRDTHFAKMLVAKRVDGVVLVPTTDPEPALRELRDGQIPCVVIEQDVPDTTSVVVNSHRTGQLVTDHLLGLGHSRIAMLREHRTSLDSWKRFDGYADALSGAGIPLNPDHIADAGPSLGGGIVDASLEAAAKLLAADPRPTAVFAHNDLMAIAVVHEAKRLGLRVPDDLSVVGVDNIEAGRYTDPPLTTLQFPARELGQAAARRLLELIQGNDVEHLTTIEPPEIEVRASSGPPPT